ncbi:MAG: MarC family protein [Candidatus Thiodiazotropha sp.]
MTFPMHDLQTLVGLIVIVNPLLAVTAFATLTQDNDLAQRRVTAQRAALTVGIVLSLAALVGRPLLHVLGIGLPAFQVGGGILILLMAIAMLHARMSGARHTQDEANEAIQSQQIGVVPLGIPLLAGPGAISTVIIYAHQQSDWLWSVLLVGEICLVAGLVWLALSLGDRLIHRLGQTGVNVASRIMGLILAAIAVQFMTHGLQSLLPGLA